MHKIIAFANQKGGVGKTTSCINVSASLVAQKQKVLMIDLDPQGNATMGSGVEKTHLTHTVNEALMEEVPLQETIIERTIGGFSLIPANSELTQAEVALLRKGSQEENLKKALAAIQNHYDYIILDCPPSLNMLTLNALVAADSVIIPMQCEYYALEGLSALLNTIERIRQNWNPNLQIEGIIRTMYDPRNRLSTEVSAQLIAHFGDKVYQTVIPRNIRLAEAPSHGMPILVYDKGSRGSDAYFCLAGEMMRSSRKKPTGGSLVFRNQQEESILEA